jgi:adenylylsulfate kinase
LLGQNSKILWFTGLSGSGKSTIANKVEEILHDKGFTTYLLDGDNIRTGLNSDLKFSDADRKENIRRVGEVAKLFVDTGVIVLASFISPYRDDRHMVRQMVEKIEFLEIYVNCPIEICEERDAKGLYKKARAGEIKNFTGIDSDYEAPERPDMEIQSDKISANDAADKIVKYILKKLELD